MSDLYTQLVVNLIPTGRLLPGPVSSIEPRNRFVLFVLAYLADEDGQCTISLTDLAALTLGSPPMVRKSLRELENLHGFLTVSGRPSEPNTYHLDRAELETQQASALARAQGTSVTLLVEYGLDHRSVNALKRAGIGTLDELGAQIAKYRALPSGKNSGFHAFLKAHLKADGIGERSASKVISSYAAWSDDLAKSV